MLNAYTVQAWYWELVEMLRKLILTVALAALYQGEPAQLAGSLLTIFVFLVLHMLLKPYLNQGLNVFQRLALISQFFTVFGGLMFVVTDLTELQNTSPAGNGKTLMSWLIMIINVAASSIYPVHRFFNAWSESGEIDFNLMINGIKKMAEQCLGPEVVASLFATCSCLGKVKDVADQAQEKINEAKEVLRDTGIPDMAENFYTTAKDAKEQVFDEAREIVGEGSRIKTESKELNEKQNPKHKKSPHNLTKHKKNAEDEEEEDDAEEDEAAAEDGEEEDEGESGGDLLGGQLSNFCSFFLFRFMSRRQAFEDCFLCIALLSLFLLSF